MTANNHKLSDKSNIPSGKPRSSKSSGGKKKKTRASKKSMISQPHQSHLVNAKETRDSDFPNQDASTSPPSWQGPSGTWKEGPVSHGPNGKPKQRSAPGGDRSEDATKEQPKSNKPRPSKKPSVQAGSPRDTITIKECAEISNQNRDHPEGKPHLESFSNNSDRNEQAFNASASDASASVQNNRKGVSQDIATSTLNQQIQTQHQRTRLTANVHKQKQHRKSNYSSNRRKKSETFGKSFADALRHGAVAGPECPAQGRDADADVAFGEDAHSECKRMEHSPSPTFVPKGEGDHESEHLHGEYVSDYHGSVTVKDDSISSSENDAEIETETNHVKTNAAGQALLNRISFKNSGDDAIPPTPPVSLDETVDEVNSLYANQSSTEKSDLIEEMARIDMNLDQGQEYYDDSSATMAEMVRSPAAGMVWQGSASQGMAVPSGINECPSPSQQYTHQAWTAMMPPPHPHPPDSQECYSYAQVPMFISMNQFGQEYFMPHQAYPMVYNSFQNVQGYEYPPIPSPEPLTYQQVSIGGTVFFNPVYGHNGHSDDGTVHNGNIHYESRAHEELLETKAEAGVEAEKDLSKAKKGKKRGNGGKKGQASKKVYGKGKSETSKK